MVWEFEADRAEEALRTRKEFLVVIRRLAGESADTYVFEIVFAEIVGNVIRHAPGPIRMELHHHGDDVLLAVRDHGPGFSLRTIEPDLYSENGRGLFLVAKLAKRLEVERAPGGGSIVRTLLPLKAA
ncbi:MAG: ATP-binding protein [Candidatus Eremiobacteraeota bacterium]|nr:ATP-binding protein [Candidatus Eremiobacteraeota bacterium]